MRDTIGELWIQIRISVIFEYDISGVLKLVTRELQVALYADVLHIERLLYRRCVFSVLELDSGYKLRVNLSKHASQSLSDRPFNAYSVLRRIT